MGPRAFRDAFNLITSSPVIAGAMVVHAIEINSSARSGWISIVTS